MAGRGEKPTSTMRRLGQGSHRQPRSIVEEAPRGSTPHLARASPESALPATRFASGGREMRSAEICGCRSPLKRPLRNTNDRLRRFAADRCAGSRVAFRFRCMRPGKQRMELALGLSTALSRTPATQRSGVEGDPGSSARSCREAALNRPSQWPLKGEGASKIGAAAVIHIQRFRGSAANNALDSASPRAQILQVQREGGLRK